ncbi:putative reverse transcriptase domain-containing protein, partial [Tanacetum coccineum]
MLGIEPSDLGFRYKIEIASGQLVEIDKVIKGGKLEIEGHVFDIDLIPFGHGSFDVIIGMDWLSNYKAKIICHEKVVRIPLPDGKVLRVVGRVKYSDDESLGRLKLTDLMDMCTKLSERVLDLEHTKTAQAQEITNLRLRVKKLEKKARLRTYKFKRLYKVGVTRQVEYSDDE